MQNGVRNIYKGYMDNGVEQHTQYSCIPEIGITLNIEA